MWICKSLWAILDITDSATRNLFIATATIVGLVTLFVAFNLEDIIGLCNGQRANLVREMRKDEDWKELGTKLPGIQSQPKNTVRLMVSRVPSVQINKESGGKEEEGG